ncbi:MAG: hypothetical protein AAGK22_26985, partial [Acidobacteriota bacterium]
MHRLALLLVLGTLLAPGSQATETVDSSLLSALEWRLVGPYRGGRVMTVAGVPGNPQLYYMGATGGGVWKTENAGLTWENLSDGYFNVGTIGALAVAASDPNVIYVGTGEKSIRGVTTSHGDGMYKSTDAGETWTHIGLPKAGQIARIKIHPKDPDLAYVAVQGQIWGKSDERGVYRTKDGGETWELVLSVDSQTGATDLRMDPTNPRVLYASMWEHGRTPWYVLSGGQAGGVFKSTDGGESWKKLTNGLPELIGKVGIDVSASNPKRLYAIVEAMPGEGGLYRSDDGGESWQLKNESRILWTRSWYYMHIAADPVDDDVVYVLNAPFMKSVDGGLTFEKKSTPHSDHHDHWINPDDNRNMINANDGGATITFDGGKSWSSLLNQPTAQFYRVNTDNEFPYRIYGGQQDNSTVAILSETYDGGIGNDDFFSVGGGESAHIAFDPEDPKLIYATTINGTLTEYNRENQRVRQIKPYPEFVFGMESRDLRYRTNWNAPVTASPHDPNVIYYGTEKVLQTKDRGVTSAGQGCQGMQIDRCQFISQEQPLRVQDRVSIGFNANCSDIKVRDNRAVKFLHFGVLGGPGNIISGNHFFQGDDETNGLRSAGLIITRTNARTTLTSNYIDNCFVEWGNEHDAAPELQGEFSFHGLSVNSNMFFASNATPFMKFILIKPY